MKDVREVLARAYMALMECGATVEGETVFCDDPRLREVCGKCDCFKAADAILAVLAIEGLQVVKEGSQGARIVKVERRPFSFEDQECS